MPLLGFDRRFVEAVESGAKRQTIRARRADGRDPKAGDTLYLYTGLRTKAARKLAEVRCRSVATFRIGRGGTRVVRGGIRLDRARLARLARRDGFKNASEFLEFFERRHGFPFDGLLIRW